jgi:predicted dehydrogenase
MTAKTVRVGVLGTSWWADTMYLPPLDAHPDCEIVAVCGRRAEPAKSFSENWNIPQWFTDPNEMFDSVEMDAVVIATSNDSHYDLATNALDRGLHVLCEKPLARNAVEGEAIATKALETGAITMVPFTYHYMPVNRFVKRLIDEGFVGRPHHVNIRYYTEFGFDSSYSWRFDKELAGSGIIGDIGSHWIHLARWLLDDVETSLTATSATFTDRANRPDGSDYERCEDSVAMTIKYSSGAYGVLQTCAVSWEGTPFGQTHHLEVHGDGGTIYATCDWDTVQEVRVLKRGELGPAKTVPIPDDIWNGARQDTVHNTYRDVFRRTDVMTRGWVSSIRDGRQITPDFTEGQAVQRVLDAVVASAAADGAPMWPHGRR